MPIGCTSLVPRIIQDFEDSKCRFLGMRILDLGCGFGLWGVAVRQWVDQGVRPFNTYMMGIEGELAYGTPVWEIYDFIHAMKIEDWLAWEASKKDRFDVILFLDVIEHFTHEEGSAILEQVVTRLSPKGRLYVGTPAVWQEQDALWGNELERHRSLWTPEDLTSRGFTILESGETPNAYGHQMLLGVYENDARQ